MFAIKSRFYFRRGFDDSGFARTILLVEPEQPFLGTVRLDALPYRNVDLKAFYPGRKPGVSGPATPAPPRAGGHRSRGRIRRY